MLCFFSGSFHHIVFTAENSSFCRKFIPQSDSLITRDKVNGCIYRLQVVVNACDPFSKEHVKLSRLYSYLRGKNSFKRLQ